MSARRRRGDRRAAAVFIVAASEVVRAGLESLVEEEARFAVAGSAADLSEFAARWAEGVYPEVVLFDAEGQADEALADLRIFTAEAAESDGGDDAPAFVVIGATEDERLWEALREGLVRAVLPRAASGGEIVAAVEAAAAGLVALPAEILAGLLPPHVPPDGRLRPSAYDGLPPAGQNPEALTPREREVLEMLAEGLSNKEAAWRLKISEHTVKFHVASIFAKLDASTRTEAVTRAVRLGLIMV